MTAPDHAATTDPPEPVDGPPVDADPPSQGGDDGNREENLRALVTARDEWQKKAEAAHQVLQLVGIELDEDGSFDPNQLEDWHEQTKTARERARRDLLLESGFTPESVEGELIGRMLDAGELDAEPTAIEAYALERRWTKNAVLYSGVEDQVVKGSERLTRLDQASTSEAGADVQTDVEAQIAEAREQGDYATASKLQTRYERKLQSYERRQGRYR